MTPQPTEPLATTSDVPSVKRVNSRACMLCDFSAVVKHQPVHLAQCVEGLPIPADLLEPAEQHTDRQHDQVNLFADITSTGQCVRELWPQIKLKLYLVLVVFCTDSWSSFYSRSDHH